MQIVVTLCRAPPPHLPWATYVDHDDEIILLGCPFGSEASIRTVLKKKLDELSHLWTLVSEIPNTQIALILLAQCLGECRVNHWLRSLPPHLTGWFALAVRQGLQETLERILGGSMTTLQWHQ